MKRDILAQNDCVMGKRDVLAQIALDQGDHSFTGKLPASRDKRPCYATFLKV